MDVVAPVRDTQPKERVYFAAMDGLRFVAVVGVFILHLSNVTGMTVRNNGSFGPLLYAVSYTWTAVPVFFAISGFLLFWPWAMAAREGRPMPSVRAYYWHRFIRIMPAYWIMALVALLVFYRYVFSQVWRFIRIMLLQQITILTDIPQNQNEPFHGGALSQTWSLGTEFQFYLILPVLGYVLYRMLRARREAYAIGLLTVLIVGTVIWRLTVSGPFFAAGNFGRFWIVAWMAYFAVGMLLAIIAVQLRFATSPPTGPVAFLSRHPWLCWGAAALAYLVLSAPPSLHNAVVEEVCVLLICAGLITPVVLSPGKGPERLLRKPVMAWLGRISYGIFLWHIFIQLIVLRIAGLQWGTQSVGAFLLLIPITGGLSILVAYLSYVLVELPIQRRFRMRKGQHYVGRAVEEPKETVVVGPEPALAG
jgi:peptidoglycan/LPS O-acetylase OafA/YrhL